MYIAKLVGANAHIKTNPSGSIDRGCVSGFIEKNNVVVYISINDGMQNILYRTSRTS